MLIFKIIINMWIKIEPSAMKNIYEGNHVLNYE